MRVACQSEENTNTHTYTHTHTLTHACLEKPPLLSKLSQEFHPMMQTLTTANKHPLIRECRVINLHTQVNTPHIHINAALPFRPCVMVCLVSFRT